MAKKVLVVGASGVVGSAAAEAFLEADWDVVTVSRRAPDIAATRAFQHLSVDLLNAEQSRAVLGQLTDITHVMFAALYEKPGLIKGWEEADQMETNLSMIRNCMEPLLAASKSLQHVSLLQGTKAYGFHLHPIPIPARERAPRDPHANFYWLQEDFLKQKAAAHGFSCTIFRPPMIVGRPIGVPMNPAPVIGMYAAICKEEGESFGFPGGPPFVWECVDSRIVGKAFVWAAESPNSRNQHFNVTNGDLFDWRELWPAIADALGIKPGPPVPLSMATYLPAKSAVWDRIVAKRDLRPLSSSQVLGDSHYCADYCFGYGLTEPPPPTFLSTIKIRQAGFTACCDTEDTYRYWLGSLIERRILPPR